jgi:hypothetical protein
MYMAIVDVGTFSHKWKIGRPKSRNIITQENTDPASQ